MTRTAKNTNKGCLERAKIQMEVELSRSPPQTFDFPVETREGGD